MEQRYKLICTAKGDSLYDIENDPAEQNDLSTTLPDVTERMKRELIEWKSGVLAELEAVQ